MATAKNENIMTDSMPTLSPALSELLNELRTNVKVLDPKKANVRLVKRTLATIKAVIADIEEEVSK